MPKASERVMTLLRARMERQPVDFMVRDLEGLLDGELRSVEIMNPGSAVANYAFDVTPARLVTGLITERGICAASEEGVLSLFPERR